VTADLLHSAFDGLKQVLASRGFIFSQAACKTMSIAAAFFAALSATAGLACLAERAVMENEH